MESHTADNYNDDQNPVEKEHLSRDDDGIFLGNDSLSLRTTMVVSFHERQW